MLASIEVLNIIIIIIIIIIILYIIIMNMYMAPILFSAKRFTMLQKGLDEK